MSYLRILVLFGILPASLCWADGSGPRVGDSEKVYTLAADNMAIRGLAWDEASPRGPRLLVLDASGKLFSYEPGSEASLKAVETYDLGSAVAGGKLHDPRGLALAIEKGEPVVYFADRVGAKTLLWRYPMDGGKAESVDLSHEVFRIGDREVFDLARDGDALLISYDASGHADQSTRVQRGIVRVAWDVPFGDSPASVRHLPDAGTASSRGLAVMRMGGVGYLWATDGDEHIYCADLPSGRGLFFFDRPTSSDVSTSCRGIAFGRDSLWVSESGAGVNRVHRVNVTTNLDAPLEGPHAIRRLEMTITTNPEAEGERAGAVYHNYSRPYGHRVLGNQGIWPETETVGDISGADNATVRTIIQDPAGDASSRQVIRCVEYADGPARTYQSRYEIDLWTNPYKKFVYPHRVDCDRSALAGTDYLGDDRLLYNLADTATYDAFIRRVRDHITRKYGVDAEMDNPYWAARNIVEYLQDNYYYPNREKHVPATVDYDRGHYDANPANLKIELSDHAYDKRQIIACSGTSVMVTAAMRHLGFPARWLGTGTPRGPADWDANGNGLLDADETGTCSNGHRYTQVWLGSHYGWICFDATPSKPAYNDYDVPPPLQSQWRYMTRCASGHREPNRIVFNVGSEFIEPLYRDFEYDPRLAIDNNCGGDQRYNLQGRFDKPELWKLAGNAIRIRNLCFVAGIKVSPKGRDSEVAWRLEGAWDRVPDALLSVHLEQRVDGRWRDVVRLARSVPAAAGSAKVDLSGHTGNECRIIIRREGDPETGGVSEAFRLD